jgi:protocatechuate 3,4-dioxygenase beta subunit
MAASYVNQGRGPLAAAIGLLLLLVAALAVLLWLRRKPEAPPQTSGEQPATSPALYLAESAGSTAVETGALSGRVLDPDGAGLAGAVVVAQRHPAREDRFPAPQQGPVVRRSERDGRFRFEGLAPGDYSVGASAPSLLAAARAGIALAARGEVTGIELRLGRGGIVLSGRVIDASGGTVPGARVLAERIGALPGGGVGEIGVFAGDSDGQGRYQRRLAPGRYRLLASADGYTEAHDYIELRADQTHDLRLEPAAHISGRVVTADGDQPVADAEVLASPTEMRRRLSYGPAVTDQAGAFRIDGLPPDGYLLSARKGVLVGRVRQPVVVASAAAAQDVRIAVSAGAVVTGTVRSQAGAAIAGAFVQVWTPDPALRGVVAGRSFSDAQGRYRMEGIEPGEHRFGVDADGFISEREELSVSGTVTRDVVLGQGAEVTALVLGVSGRPAARAQVGAGTRRDGPEGSGGDYDSGVTDDEGRYRFRRLEPGLLTVEARQGDALGRSAPEPLELGTPKEVTVRLQPAARVSGKVLWDDGTPAAGVTIDVRFRSPEEGGFPGRPSGPDGAFSLGPFFPAAITVMATVPGDVTYLGPETGPDKIDLTVGSGEHRAGIVLTLARRNRSIQGVVLGPGGQPIAGVVVQAEAERGGMPMPRFFAGRTDGGRAITGGDGAFALDGLATGTFTVWLAHPDHPELARPGVAAGTRGLRLQLARGATLAGVVVTPTGQPLTAYQISITPADDEATPPQHRLYPKGVGEGIEVQDPGGAFRLQRLPPGRYDVAAFTDEDNIQFARLQGVTLRPGEIKQGLRLVTGAPPPNMRFVRARVR